MPLVSRKGILAITAVIDVAINAATGRSQPRRWRRVEVDEARRNPPLPAPRWPSEVVKPALAEAERTFSVALARISVEDMARRAAALK